MFRLKERECQRSELPVCACVVADHSLSTDKEITNAVMIYVIYFDLILVFLPGVKNRFRSIACPDKISMVGYRERELLLSSNGNGFPITGPL